MKALVWLLAIVAFVGASIWLGTQLWPRFNPPQATNMKFEEVYSLQEGYPKEKDDGTMEFYFKRTVKSGQVIQPFIENVPKVAVGDGVSVPIIIVNELLQPGTARLIQRGTVISFVRNGMDWGTITASIKTMEYNPHGGKTIAK